MGFVGIGFFPFPRKRFAEAIEVLGAWPLPGELVQGLEKWDFCVRVGAAPVGSAPSAGIARSLGVQSVALKGGWFPRDSLFRDEESTVGIFLLVLCLEILELEGFFSWKTCARHHGSTTGKAWSTRPQVTSPGSSKSWDSPSWSLEFPQCWDPFSWCPLGAGIPFPGVPSELETLILDTGIPSELGSLFCVFCGILEFHLGGSSELFGNC